MSAAPHVPVMVHEVVKALAPKAGGIYVDATFGAGGYTKAILESAPCRVIGIDRDPAAADRAKALGMPDRLRFIPGCFGALATHLEPALHGTIAGVAMDLGVSSPQLDEAERGFSFKQDGPLDMRMSGDGPTAADIVNGWPEADLARVIHDYGEERHARRVARAIVTARRDSPLTRTGALASVVRRVVPSSKDGIDTATRTFQGLRIAVNDELRELEDGLAGAETVLAPGGRLAVVAFHSLEDRIVKRFLADRSGRTGTNRHAPAAESRPVTFRVLTRKPLLPTEAETRTNPRSRSARLRVAERLEVAA